MIAGLFALIVISGTLGAIAFLHFENGEMPLGEEAKASDFEIIEPRE